MLSPTEKERLQEFVKNLDEMPLDALKELWREVFGGRLPPSHKQMVSDFIQAAINEANATRQAVSN